MTSEGAAPWQAIVLRDGAGDYYELPRELVDKVRAPDGRATEVTAFAGEQDEVSGYTIKPGPGDPHGKGGPIPPGNLILPPPSIGCPGWPKWS
jgi:hypothetical protein